MRDFTIRRTGNGRTTFDGMLPVNDSESMLGLLLRNANGGRSTELERNRSKGHTSLLLTELNIFRSLLVKNK